MWFMSLFSFLSSLSFRKTLVLVVICLSLLLMSWESQKIDAALLQTAIPEESIRLRILAHSDAPQDQAIKMLVRDRVVEKMNSWSNEASNIEDARAIVATHLQQLNETVAAVLAENGQSHSYDVTLSQVDFPTKSYGGLVYPGGEYEALLITIGDAKGRNWWCVLFPPLCFTDTVSGEATAVVKDTKEAQVSTIEQDATKVTEQEIGTEHDVEVKFFITDAWNWITGLFA